MKHAVMENYGFIFTTWGSINVHLNGCARAFFFFFLFFLFFFVCISPPSKCIRRQQLGIELTTLCLAAQRYGNKARTAGKIRQKTSHIDATIQLYPQARSVISQSAFRLALFATRCFIERQLIKRTQLHRQAWNFAYPPDALLPSGHC